MISPHLAEAEFISTQHRDIWDEQLACWSGQPLVQANAQRFAVSVFERVRELVGPLHVTSGYRCPELNSAVGGRKDSRHMVGLAADVIPMETTLPEAMATIVRAFDAGALPDVDEAIIEMGWLHLQAATDKPARRLALQTDDGLTYRPWVRRST